MAEIVKVSLTTMIFFLIGGYFIAGSFAGFKTAAEIRKREHFSRNALILFLGFVTMGIYDFWIYGFSLDFVFILAVETYLISILPEDIREHRISSVTTIAFAVLFLLLRALTFDVFEVIDAVGGCVLGLASIGIPYLINKNLIGLGDVMAAAACGIIFGMVGIVQFLIRAFVFIAVFSLIQLLRRRVGLKTEMPFVPFLLLAALL